MGTIKLGLTPNKPAPKNTGSPPLLKPLQGHQLGVEVGSGTWLVQEPADLDLAGAQVSGS